MPPPPRPQARSSATFRSPPAPAERGFWLKIEQALLPGSPAVRELFFEALAGLSYKSPAAIGWAKGAGSGFVENPPVKHRRLR